MVSFGPAEFRSVSKACMRSVVGTLAPLFLNKMIQRAFLQPAPGHI